MLPPAAALLTPRDVSRALGYARRSRDCVSNNFEAMLRAYFGVRHVFLTSSGRAALTVVLRSIAELRPGGEVVVPGYTCFTVPSAVARAGLKVMPVDIEPSTLDYDPDALRESLSENTLAVVAVHPYGFPCGIREIEAICAERGIPLIEDAAQAMGGRVESRMIGTFGDAAILSFGRGKAMTTVHGGAILTSSDVLASAIARTLAQHQVPAGGDARHAALAFAYSLVVRPRFFSMVKRIRRLEVGVTRFCTDFEIAPMSNMQAALGMACLGGLGETNKIRRRNAGELSRMLREVESISVLGERDWEYSIALRQPVVLDSEAAAENAYRELSDLGLGVGRSYPSSITDIPGAASFLSERAAIPFNAREASRRLLTLPTHHFVTPRDLDAIARVVTKYAGAAHRHVATLRRAM
ncbi:MAG: aminotransferase class I/II-fold pyridoxal phosphate-dependent enzyme [Armatimonadetes bacterium]|nr:aminotransferase class I/II-fold pyridoxal phosphate-dependent enzyme [Armatimonadota bacterium]